MIILHNCDNVLSRELNGKLFFTQVLFILDGITLIAFILLNMKNTNCNLIEFAERK